LQRLPYSLVKEGQNESGKNWKMGFYHRLVLAVLAGIFFQPRWAIWVLAILGMIVGLLNVTAEETRGFLLASIALTLSATALNTPPVIGTALSYIPLDPAGCVSLRLWRYDRSCIERTVPDRP
jgi:hypothetical protein